MYITMFLTTVSDEPACKLINKVPGNCGNVVLLLILSYIPSYPPTFNQPGKLGLKNSKPGLCHDHSRGLNCSAGDKRSPRAFLT